MSRARWLLVALLLLVTALPGPDFVPGGVGAAETPLAPRFKVKSVTGATLDLERLRLQGPVLIDFWATWCKPCIAALPEIESLHRRFGPRGLTVIGVSVDGPRNFLKVRPFAQRLGLGYPIALDEDGSLQERFGVRAIPTTVLISSDGRLLRVTQGWRPGETADLAAAIETLLPDTTGSARP
jgi:peroxiredoxin